MTPVNVLNIFVIIGIFLSRCEGSQKQGLAIGGRNFLCGDFKAYGNVNWWYNWSVKNFSRTGCTGLEKYDSSHVPMVWGKWGINKLTIPRNAEAVLGFNEPNHKQQSNLLPQEAAKLWPLIEKAAPGIPLVSPSASPCGGPRCHGNDTSWFDAFFEACKGCRVDYLATHYYTCNPNKTMEKLSFLYKRYGLKIWLSEFACQQTKNPDKEKRFMKEIIPRLEKAEFVYRYAWFASRIVSTSGFITNAASLLQANTSTLTELGDVYVSFKDQQEPFFERFMDMLDVLSSRLRDFFSGLAKKLRLQ